MCLTSSAHFVGTFPFHKGKAFILSGECGFGIASSVGYAATFPHRGRLSRSARGRVEAMLRNLRKTES